MAHGTDAEIFKGEVSLKTKTSGRPRVNRQLGYQLLKAGYKTGYIRRVLQCSARTVRLMRQELKAKGDLEPVLKTEDLDKLALTFDDECVRAVGISFYEWLKSKNKGYKAIFSFCKRTWLEIWAKPSLVLVRDRDQKIGDQIAMKFLEVFGEDSKRIRRRKKAIRYLFRYLGRRDLCDRYLTMTMSRDPEEIREIPELTLLEFPQRLEQAIKLVDSELGQEASTALRFKIATQMRTGAEERELMGITAGDANGSWLVMTSPDQYRGQIIAKRREKWVLEWLPKEVRDQLWTIYQERERGDKLFKFDINELRSTFKNACEKAGLPPLHLHDLRKVSITWFWVMGIDLAIACELNVGWKNTDTAKKYYLTMNELLKKKDRLAYRQRIPEWFKEGLDEYLPF